LTAVILLQQRLQTATAQWMAAGYPHAQYRALGEILAWAQAPDGNNFRLRPPQLRALTTYWYLRLVLDTPHILDLYQQLFPATNDWQAALQVPRAAWQATGEDRERFLAALHNDDKFVARYQLESLRESATLIYPSYILALAMGVGKTVLIGSILASEFALALEYPAGPFVQNALIFAPGRTILESLRELIGLPYAAILPPHLYRSFAAAVKFTVTQDGERDIAVMQGSAFNVIITNTEKIRIQKEKVRKRHIGLPLVGEGVAAAKQEIANLRLQTIASLPRLAIFSDEAHHTYGQALRSDLKKVRKTVDYLAARTEVTCVINTTGTPYFKRQPLRDVVVWYGLAEGIRDGILKEVADNLVTYALADHTAAQATAAREQVLIEIVRDFFQHYATVTLPDGTPAKLAIYFPKTADIAQSRPAIERALVALGESPTTLLEHHTYCENPADFDRFRSRQSPHRIVLLVDRGVEGWDVPALFACALVRKLKTSNNFVLQATARCLRQTPGNLSPARIYLSAENRTILERQLRATYGESLEQLTQARTANATRPTHDPIPAVWPARMLSGTSRSTPLSQLSFTRPPAAPVKLTQTTHRLSEQGLQATGNTNQLIVQHTWLDLYSVAVELAAIYRLDLWLVYDALRETYGAPGLLATSDLRDLCRQLEAQTHAAAEPIKYESGTK